MKKVCVVTGATRGIGLSIAQNLEQNGYTVVYSASSQTHETAENYIPCDISDPKARQHLLDETIKRFGRVDVLVNNAGVAPIERLDILKTTEESFERLMKINLEGTFFMCQLFGQKMVELAHKDCKIINISSISSYASSVERGEYCISKAGISMVTQLFASRLAEFGICVFEVRPGIILTDMTAARQELFEKKIAEGLLPTKRMGYPQDVANCVLALCSGLFDFSTGQVINADGGFHLRRF